LAFLGHKKGLKTPKNSGTSRRQTAPLSQTAAANAGRHSFGLIRSLQNLTAQGFKCDFYSHYKFDRERVAVPRHNEMSGGHKPREVVILSAEARQRSAEFFACLATLCSPHRCRPLQIGCTTHYLDSKIHAE
jgi:hypothetical protein